MKKWIIAIYLLSSHKKGISSHQLARDIGVTQKTAFYMLKRLRYGFKNANLNEDLELEGIIEVDETFVGGKNKNRHKQKKVPHTQGRSFIDKTPVFGMLQRGGRLAAVVVPNTRAESITPIIRKHIKPGSTIYSDEWWAYNSLHKDYVHEHVHHGIGFYGVGEVHTNTIEGSWTFLKRSIIGVYHSVSKKYLQSYVDEFVFRYNTHKWEDAERMRIVLSLCCVRSLYNDFSNG